MTATQAALRSSGICEEGGAIKQGRVRRYGRPQDRPVLVSEVRKPKVKRRRSSGLGLPRGTPWQLADYCAHPIPTPSITSASFRLLAARSDGRPVSGVAALEHQATDREQRRNASGISP